MPVEAPSPLLLDVCGESNLHIASASGIALIPRIGDQSAANRVGQADMGLFDAIIGNANQIDQGKIASKLDGILLPGEMISLAYKLVRDYFVFTEKRLLMVDVQGITGRKIEYLSVPYKSITRYALETAGTFDLDAELKIWVSGDHNPIVRTLKHGTDIKSIQLALSMGVLQ